MTSCFSTARMIKPFNKWPMIIAISFPILALSLDRATMNRLISNIYSTISLLSHFQYWFCIVLKGQLEKDENIKE
jgi:hypothetical protein